VNRQFVHKLIPDFVSAAHIRRMVAQATRDAFNAGRAMTLRPMEAM